MLGELVFWAGFVLLIVVKVRDALVAHRYDKGVLESMVSPPPGKTWQSMVLLAILIPLAYFLGYFP